MINLELILLNRIIVHVLVQISMSVWSFLTSVKMASVVTQWAVSPVGVTKGTHWTKPGRLVWVSTGTCSVH